MQYVDYIAQYQARREREQQLIAKYNQPKCEHRNRNIWMMGMERHSSIRITGKEVLEILIGMALVGGILILAIVLG